MQRAKRPHVIVKDETNIHGLRQPALLNDQMNFLRRRLLIRVPGRTLLQPLP